MTESEGTAVTPASSLEYLKTLPWCKQGEGVLVAVGKANSEVIELMKDHEVKVFPGGIVIKMQKSVITNFQRHIDDELPLNVVIVWKADSLEIWYRKVNPLEYPYDAWSNTAAAAYEQERVLVPSSYFGESFEAVRSEILGKASVCPSMMPQY